MKDVLLFLAGLCLQGVISAVQRVRHELRIRRWNRERREA